MKKGKNPDRPFFYPIQNWPADSIDPVDTYNLLGVFPPLPPSVPDSPLEETEDL